MSKVAVVYFSCTETTKSLATKAAKAASADLIEIVPEKAYSSADLDWTNKKSRSCMENAEENCRPAMKGKADISAYETVIFCYPIWWGIAPKIVYTFAESADFSGKNLIALCTSGGSGLGHSGTDLSKHAKGSAFKGGKDLTGASEASVKKFLDSLK